MKRLLLFLIVCIVAVALVACDTEDPFNFQDDFSTVPAPYDTSGVNKAVLGGGLIIYTHNPGEGPFTANVRDQVRLFFTFRLKDGTIVQSTWANGRTDPDLLMLPTTITGFQRGIEGLKEGGRRTIIIPPALGYGNTTNSPYREDTLYYDIDLVTIVE
jgi:FKBP-type peptidyl-prolyl cis-trans isomerase